MTLFMDGISHKGDFLHLPAPGGTMNQPVRTMEVLRCMKVCFVRHIDAEQEKAMGRPTGV